MAFDAQLALQRATSDRPDDTSLPQIHLMYVLPSDGADRALRRVLAERQALAAARAEEARRAEQAARQQAEQTVARIRQLVTSMVTGYTMSVQRLERAPAANFSHA